MGIEQICEGVIIDRKDHSDTLTISKAVDLEILQSVNRHFTNNPQPTKKILIDIRNNEPASSDFLSVIGICRKSYGNDPRNVRIAVDYGSHAYTVLKVVSFDQQYEMVLRHPRREPVERELAFSNCYK